MPTNSLERQKGELLSRVAQQRMLALGSVDSVCRSAQAGVAAVQGSGRFLRYISLAATGLVAAGVCTFAAKSVRPRSKAVVSAPTAGGFFSTLLLQSITVVLFPYLRDILSTRLHAPAAPRRSLLDLSRYSPGRVFFRWLGLEK